MFKAEFNLSHCEL